MPAPAVAGTAGPGSIRSGAAEAAGTVDGGTGSGGAGSGAVSRLADGLVPMPDLPLPDPLSRVGGATEVPESSRFCGECGAQVGRGYAGQPGLLEGYCRRCQTPFSFTPKLHRGDLVADQYEVEGCLARGGLGWVYLARDTHLDGNLVALKGLITKNAAALRMAVAERRFLTALDHPNIVRIFNSVTHQDPQTREQTGYIVMEYLNGQSLQDVLEVAARGAEPLPIEHVLAYGHEILAALDYLHSRGLLYCDMKPANVIRCPERIKVIDIGGVRRIDDSSGPSVTTEFFRPPEYEIHRHGLTVRSDIHTVGRTLQVLFEVSDEGRPAGTPENRIAFGVESFLRLVNRAVARRDRRFATAAEMSQQLTGVLREVLSLRTGRPHPARSVVFAPTPALLDGGLGAVPGLERWIRGATDLLDVTPPSPSSAAAGGLPVPIVDPDDDAADLLATAGAADPRGLIEKLANSGRQSVEVQFALCRAYLAAGDLDRAARCLDEAVAELGARPDQDWRIRWHNALLCLARADVAAGSGEFDAVYTDCPGEIAPKLALGFCAEHLAEYARAERCYEAVWRRDNSVGSAAFGLARLRLRDGDRAGAVRILDEVPRESLHYERAGVAAVRILCGRLPAGVPSAGRGGSGAGGPTSGDLAEALRRLPALHLDGGNETGEARDRLTALVQVAALGLVRRDAQVRRDDPARVGAGGVGGVDAAHAVEDRDADGRLGDADGLGDGGEVLGRELTEDDLRRRLERSMRVLAGQARTADDHGALVDLANTVRPRTRW
ncbi:tetratricopeptide repeat protein [Plantactinospora sp. WMMB334]|uniref:serine/threonine-protein kinase n=1 Tax=Plantactinospora sp. WMMB334 TaxID=3404119 RepID=UPI003B95274B